MGKGSGYKGNGKTPEQPLVYWGYEASPFCKVRPYSLRIATNDEAMVECGQKDKDVD